LESVPQIRQSSVKRDIKALASFDFIPDLNLSNNSVTVTLATAKSTGATFVLVWQEVLIIATMNKTYKAFLISLEILVKK
jgi:hypothetical protein